MKTQTILLLLLLVAFSTKAQKFDLDSMGEVLKKEIPKGYAFRKLQKINGKRGRPLIEYEYFFSKDSLYSLDLLSADGEAEGIVMTLFDLERGQIKVSYQNLKFLKSLSFQPTQSGIYSVRFTFKDSHSYQGVSILSAKKIVKNTISNDSLSSEFWANEALKKIPKEFKFIKAFAIKEECRKDIEYTCVFSEGTEYRIDVSTFIKMKIKVIVRNASREMVATNDHKNKRKMQTTINYICPKAGIYYIGFSFIDSSPRRRIGGAVLSLYRDPNYKPSNTTKPIKNLPKLSKNATLLPHLSPKIDQLLPKNKINFIFTPKPPAKEQAQTFLKEEKNIEKPFLISPNPTKDKIQIQFLPSSEKTTYLLYDSQGKQLLSGNVGTAKNEINLESFPAGVYMLHLQTEQKIWTEKIVLEK